MPAKFTIVPVRPDGQEPAIFELVHEGQALLVQVTKDPIGTKGARLTTHISVPARYLVFMPHNTHVGYLLRIEDRKSVIVCARSSRRLMEQEELKRQGRFYPAYRG